LESGGRLGAEGARLTLGAEGARLKLRLRD